jgi:hypothetical protein
VKKRRDGEESLQLDILLLLLLLCPARTFFSLLMHNIQQEIMRSLCDDACVWLCVCVSVLVMRCETLLIRYWVSIHTVWGISDVCKKVGSVLYVCMYVQIRSVYVQRYVLTPRHLGLLHDGLHGMRGLHG